MKREYQDAIAEIRQCTYLVVTAGTGMCVDSNIGDIFSTTFWATHDPLVMRGLKFEHCANLKNFGDDPGFSWGFYSHLYRLYTGSSPHEGYGVLKQWAQAAKYGYFAFTSNVDGHFQKAGFPDDRVIECHGSIMNLQCLQNCTEDIWPLASLDLTMDPATWVAEPPLPECRNCGGLARPNLMMFRDWGWLDFRTDAKEKVFRRELAQLKRHDDFRLCVVEVGAGIRIPTVRDFSEGLLQQFHEAKLIRINPTVVAADHNNPRIISIHDGAHKVLEGLAAAAELPRS